MKTPAEEEPKKPFEPPPGHDDPCDPFMPPSDEGKKR